MQNFIRVMLSILLLSCLLSMPLTYFQLLRYLIFAGFVVLAYNDYFAGREQAALVAVILSLIFQPVFKIPLGRQIWEILELTVALSLLIYVLSAILEPAKKS